VGARDPRCADRDSIAGDGPRIHSSTARANVEAPFSHAAVALGSGLEISSWSWRGVVPAVQRNCTA
jgi:hypothetical protein